MAMNELELVYRDSLRASDLAYNVRCGEFPRMTVVIVKGKQRLTHFKAIDPVHESRPVRCTTKLAIRNRLESGVLLQADHVANGLFLRGSKFIGADLTIPVFLERISE
jgi:hypothetical protein